MAASLCLSACAQPASEAAYTPSLSASSIVVDGTLLPNPSLTPVLAPTLAPTSTPVPTYDIQDIDEEPPADYAALIKRFADSEASDTVVVMGKFEKYIREDNNSRMTGNMEEPDPNYWNGVKLYEFRVESTLLGKSKVNTRRIDIALLFREQNIKQNMPSIPYPYFMEPVLDQTYVIPLVYDKDMKWYINDMSIEPQWFKVEDQLLKFETMDENAREKWAKIDPISVDAFKKILDK